MMNSCKFCKGFLAPSNGPRTRIFCSSKCNRAYHYSLEDPNRGIKIKGNCKICNKEIVFLIKQPNNFCSGKCRNIFYYDASNPDNHERVRKKRETSIKAGKIKQQKIEEERVKKGLPAKRKRKFSSAEERKSGKKEAQTKYKKTEKGVKKIKEYHQRAEVKRKVNISAKRYYKTELGAKKRKEFSIKYWAEKGEELKSKTRTPEGRAKSLGRYHKRIKVDVEYKIVRTLRGRLSHAVTSYKERGVVFKKGKTLEMLGCSMKFFLNHLENKFKRGMTWDNHGLQSYKTAKKWNIDHIEAIHKFDLTKPEQQNRCFHYSNLQPLWHTENRKKWYK